jgi:hypothetical protein
MQAALIVIGVYILTMLIWSATQMVSLRYEAISFETLNRWTTSCENLMVIHLQSKPSPRADNETVPSILDVSTVELPNLLKWMPPHSTLVFYCPGNFQRFDAKIEELLFRAEINPVYLLTLPIHEPISSTGVSGNRLLARLTHAL